MTPATLAPPAEPTMLQEARAGLDAVTLWIGLNVADHDLRKELVSKLQRPWHLVAVLERLGPTVVDDLISHAIAQAQWNNQRTARGERR